jgi:hypothetical protein
LYILWTHSAMPWALPHAKKVQFAPCHNPPSSIVIILFIYVRILPFLLPPKGIYINILLTRKTS